MPKPAQRSSVQLAARAATPRGCPPGRYSGSPERSAQHDSHVQSIRRSSSWSMWRWSSAVTRPHRSQRSPSPAAARPSGRAPSGAAGGRWPAAAGRRPRRPAPGGQRRRRCVAHAASATRTRVAPSRSSGTGPSWSAVSSTPRPARGRSKRAEHAGQASIAVRQRAAAQARRRRPRTRRGRRAACRSRWPPAASSPPAHDRGLIAPVGQVGHARRRPSPAGHRAGTARRPAAAACRGCRRAVRGLLLHALDVQPEQVRAPPPSAPS